MSSNVTATLKSPDWAYAAVLQNRLRSKAFLIVSEYSPLYIAATADGVFAFGGFFVTTIRTCMRRDYHRWHSPSLGRDMELLVFGHAGARVLVFPTSLGKYYEWEDRGMVGTLAEHIHNGWIQLFCVDSIDAESWYAKYKHPGERAWRHMQYERYLLDEVLPLSRQLNDNPFLITTGASFGAYHAVNLAFRHPHVVNRVIGLSGMYDIKTMTGGFEDHNVYVNNPAHYMSHIDDPGHLDAIRHQNIILATGYDDPHRHNNEHMSGVLWSKNIWHAFRLWNGWSHDWPYWREMIRTYIGGND